MGYKSDGTYASYGWGTDGATPYYAYRGPDASSSCAAVGGLPAVASSFSVNADGTPATTPFAQSSYDPRTSNFWGPAQSTGSAWIIG